MKNLAKLLFITIAIGLFSPANAQEWKMTGSFSVKTNPSAGGAEAAVFPRCNLSAYTITGRVEDETVQSVAEFMTRDTPFKFIVEPDLRFLVTADFDSTLESAVKDLATKTGMAYKKKDCTITFTAK